MPKPLNHPPPPHLHRPPPPHHRPPPPQHHPPPPQRRPPKSSRTTLASCIVATIFLIFIIIILFIIYFSLFKPKNPRISVTSIQLPTFSLSSNSTATPTVSFTFSHYAAVRNPNRATFSHFDSSLQLIYAGNQVGFMFIPAGNIGAGRTELMDATFSVQSFPLMPSPVTPAGFTAAVVGPPVSDGVDSVRPSLEIESRMEMVGRVRVLWFFSHHVEAVADCRVSVAIDDGSVLGFHC